MATDTPYSESPEMAEIATQLKTRYFVHLGHIDLDTVYFAEKDGTKPKKARVGEISGINSAWVKQRLVKSGDGKLYCMAVWGSEWDDMSPATREWLVFEMLYAIKPEGNGKIRKPDVNEYGPIIEFMYGQGLGHTWRESGAPLPSLLDDDPLPIPLPPLDQDDGESVDL